MTCFINSFNSISRGVLDEIKCCGYDYPSLKLGISNIYAMIEDIEESKTEWSIDKHSGVKAGDSNLFMCSASAYQNISLLRTTIKDDLDSNELLYINRLCDTYKRYAGKILSIGMVKYIPNTPDRMEMVTFEPVIGLKNPVPYDAFKSFISVNRYGSMTRLDADAYNKLLGIIKDFNPDLDLLLLDAVIENARKNAQTNNYNSVLKRTSNNTGNSKTPQQTTIQRNKAVPLEPPKMSDGECEELFPKGCKVYHKAFGLGVVKDNQNGKVTIAFADGVHKTLGVDFCVKNKLLERE